MTRIITDSHVAATLRVAASTLDVQGWHQDDYSADIFDPHGKPCCTLGAIAIACGLAPTVWECDPEDPDAKLAHLLMRRTATAFGVYVGAVDPHEGDLSEGELADAIGNGWNDMPGRTAEQVIRALRRAADFLEAAA